MLAHAGAQPGHKDISPTAMPMGPAAVLQLCWWAHLQPCQPWALAVTEPIKAMEKKDVSFGSLMVCWWSAVSCCILNLWCWHFYHLYFLEAVEPIWGSDDFIRRIQGKSGTIFWQGCRGRILPFRTCNLTSACGWVLMAMETFVVHSRANLLQGKNGKWGMQWKEDQNM